MKRARMYSLGLSLLIFSLSLNAQQPKIKDAVYRTTTTAAPANTIKGAYLMTMQKATQDNKDSMMNSKQFKIYTDGFYMYAHTLPVDTLGAFGVGSFTTQNGKLTEHSFYTSDGGMHDDSYDVDVKKTGDGYTQVINFPATSSGAAFILTENYKNVSQKLTSPLNGAWKMTKLTIHAVDGTPTVINDPVQYKFYESGHYIFGSTQMDSATKKNVSGIGYGSFTVSGVDEIIETAIHSSYRSAINAPVKLKLQFNGKDHYQQTIVWEDGSKMVEEYVRLK